MKIAAGQIRTEVGEIEKNLDRHYKVIAAASERNVDLIVFPEMSITGYTRIKGRSLSFYVNDQRLCKLKRLSEKHQLTIIAGAPILINDDLFIGSFIIEPEKQIQIYTKQFLHDGEANYYKSSTGYNPLLQLKEERISLAICADINQVEHIKNAKNKNASIYLPSIFYSKTGVLEGHKTLSNYAKDFSLNILMANFCKRNWDIEAGGRSAFWNKEGKLICSMNEQDEGLLIVEKNNQAWSVESCTILGFDY